MNKELSNNKGTKRRHPKSAAILVTSNKEDITYADILKKARDSISLDLNIQSTKIRRAANGGMLIEILGPDGANKANVLMEKLKGTLQDRARVVRPMVKGEIRLVGLDDSVTTDEIAYVVAKEGDCKEEEVRVGLIRPINNGLFTSWTQCPLNAAIKVANMKKVRIGWTLARVNLLDSRPVQCFKCWRFGHVRLACPTSDDFSGLCFKCGGAGHLARICRQPPHCKLCALEKRNPNHRLGSYMCNAEHRINSVKTNFRTTAPSGPDPTDPNPSLK